MPARTPATAAAIDAEVPVHPSVRSPSRVILAATVLEGVALAVVLGASGSTTGRAVRVAVVVVLTFGAVGVERERGPAVRTVVAIAHGVVGLLVGSAIGVSFVVRSGLSVRGMAGLVALASGIALLGSGTAGWWRAAGRRRRWLALPVAFVVFQFAVVPLFVAILVTNPPPTRVGAETPLDHGLAYETVRFAVPDTVDAELAGWYIPSRNRAAVIVLHGSGSTRSGVLDQAVVLARHGYGALLFDARGHGDSDGYPMDAGWFGEADVAAAVHFLQLRSDIDPTRIGALGESMGGEEAVTAAAGNPSIRAVVAEGVGVRTAADHPSRPGLAGTIERITAWEQYGVADLLTAADRPMPLRDAVVAARPTPILLIAGAGEEATNRRYRDASPGTVDLWELPDTGHTAALATHRAAWTSRVTAFFDRTLGDTP